MGAIADVLADLLDRFALPMLIAIGVTIVIVVVGFWRYPERTARTSALFFSFVRNLLRLKREVKADAPTPNTTGSPLNRRSAPKNMGTISAYVDDITPDDRPKR